MATCEYERQREERIAENRRRMEEMGIFTVCSSRLNVPEKADVSLLMAPQDGPVGSEEAQPPH